MSDESTLSELRAQFGRSRMLSMPIAGAIAWAAAGVFGAILPDPDQRFVVIPAAIVLVYLISIFALATRQLPGSTTRHGG